MENNIKILAIDDIEDNLISLKALIRESFPEGLVFTALNGPKGIEIATDIDPDVILLDIIMPDMDGFEVCEKLKTDTYLKNVPVVFLTALKGDKENRIRALECGGDAFLAKPIDQSELIAQIRAMVKIKKANDEQRDETERLKKMVDVQTRDLLAAHTVTKNLLYNLRKEYDIKAKSEKVLKQSEENYRNLVQHSPNIVYKFSSKNGGLFWSDRVHEILGFTEKDLLQQPFLWSESIHPDDKQAVKQVIEQKNERIDVSVEYRIKTKDERWIWLKDTFMHKIELDDDIIIEGIATDITEQKKAEETLLLANERYRMIFDNTGTSNSIFDRDCRLILQNKESVRNLGFPSNEALGKSVLELFGDKGEAVHERMQRVIQSGKSESFDTEFNLITGKKWFRSSYLPLIDEQGFVIGIQIISQDITESKHTEMMQQLSNDVVTILNKDLDIIEIGNQLLNKIQSYTNISALGIRLKKGDDYPYIASLGFSKEFLSLENSLTVKTKLHDICRNKDGKPLFCCTCGMVITGGNNNPNAPLTSTGSFWTNNSYPLLDLTKDQDARFNPRNTCIYQNYGSVAIIPIRTANAIIGTLQLNDKRTEAFTPEMISFFEGICLNIGNTLMRKQAETELRKSEADLTQALKIARLAKWELDVLTEEFTFNDLYFDLLHTTVEKEGGYCIHRNKYVERFVHPEYRHLVKEENEKAINSQDPNFESNIQSCLIRADGVQIYVLVTINVEVDDTGKVIKTIGVTQDITERKQSEDAVIESRDKFLKVFDHAPVMISISDFETGVFVDVNEYMLIVSGYDKSDIIGKKSTEINWISSDDRRILAITVLKYGKVDGLELTYITKKGMVIYGLANAQKITINNRECLLTITTNITERKLAEKQLQKNNRALQLETLQKNAIINSTDDLIWSIDLNYNLLSANDAFLFSTKQFTGHRFQIGENLLDENIYSPELIAFWKDLYQKVMSGKIVQQEFYSPQTESMPASWLDLNLNPIFFNLEFSGIACFGRNITDKKNIDEKIKNEKANLLAIFENTTDSIWTVDNNFNLMSANSVFKSLLKTDYDVEYTEGLSIDETHFFMDKMALVELYTKALHGENISYIQNVLSDGKTKYYEVFFYPIIVDQLIQGVSCRSQNITQRIIDEQTLMRRTQELRLLIDSSDDYIFSIDSVYRIITCNNSFREAIKRIIGRAPLMNESILFSEFSQKNKEQMMMAFERVLAGESLQYENQPGWQSKPHAFFSNVFNPITDLSGNIIGVVGVIRDITEFKNTERKILNATIEAEERERNHFARELHEGLGPILSAVKLYFQWFNKADLQTPKEELITNIQSIINEAIATTKEISYKLSPHVLTNFGIVFAVNSFIEKLEKTNPITFTFNSNITERFQNEIEVTLYRVITESINNSIKYAQAKEITILLNQSGGIIELTYIDDGVGFDAEKTIKEAKGLGLFNMQNRIITLNGSFELRSTIGEGVFLYVTLPVE